jgi:hypothetical protein
MKLGIKLCALVVALCAAGPAAEKSPPASKPNVILIVWAETSMACSTWRPTSASGPIEVARDPKSSGNCKRRGRSGTVSYEIPCGSPIPYQYLVFQQGVS